MERKDAEELAALKGETLDFVETEPLTEVTKP